MLLQNIAHMGFKRLNSVREIHIHEDSVEFMFYDRGIGRIISGVQDWRVEYIKGSVCLTYSNIDHITSRQMISVLKNLINAANVTEVEDEL